VTGNAERDVLVAKMRRLLNEAQALVEQVERMDAANLDPAERRRQFKVVTGGR
jgi:hypothetical protein